MTLLIVVLAVIGGGAAAALLRREVKLYRATHERRPGYITANRRHRGF